MKRGPVDINERSQQVQQTFGARFDMPVSSREQSLAVVYKRYTDEDNSSEMMVYRFRQENSQESSQTSWVKWKISDPSRVAFVSLPQDKVFVVAVDETGRCHLWRQDPDSTNYTDGWSEGIEGQSFDTVIKFPTIFARSGDNSDVMANLTIHRIKMSTSDIGTYNLSIDRKGYDPYNILVEQTPADEYKSDAYPVSLERIETVPIYTRNKNLTLTLTTNYDAPLTLRSMTWEGDYNRPIL